MVLLPAVLVAFTEPHLLSPARLLFLPAQLSLLPLLFTPVEKAVKWALVFF
jgi:hypothetical protein